MTGWAPVQAYFGLHVDFGHFHHHRGVWLRHPVARLTCRWGCEYVAVGAVDVIRFTTRTVPDHARLCPGPPM